MSFGFHLGESVVPARSKLETKSTLSSGNPVLGANEVLSCLAVMLIVFLLSNSIKRIMLWGMKKFTLTEARTNELRRAHPSATNKGDAYRTKAEYLLSRGKLPREIAEVLMLDEDTVGNYRKRYEALGVAGLLKDIYLGSA